MPVESGYKVAVVIIDRHEPEGEVATRLLELAEEKGYSPRVVEAQRGEHDAGLSFRVPKDVADAFDAKRASAWPEKDGEAETTEPAPLNGDAYEADQARAAEATRAENANPAESTSADEDAARVKETTEDTTSTRSQRAAAKAKE